tara:strand:+ start:93 stop:323 length:231 start_codon:yes stop_codon:yes gene_type:complete
MLTYYITYGDDGGTMELGTDNGFGVFWTDQGMRVLMNIVENHPERLEKTTIKTQTGESLTVGEFLEKIEKLKVRVA